MLPFICLLTASRIAATSSSFNFTKASSNIGVIRYMVTVRSDNGDFMSKNQGLCAGKVCVRLLGEFLYNVGDEVILNLCVYAKGESSTCEKHEIGEMIEFLRWGATPKQTAV